LSPRVKERHQVAGHRINARDIRPFVFIVMQAAPGQVRQDGIAAVLLGNNVVRLKRKRIEPPRNAAIVAAIACQAPKLTEQSSVHGSPGSDSFQAFKERLAFYCKIPKVWPTRM